MSKLASLGMSTNAIVPPEVDQIIETAVPQTEPAKADSLPVNKALRRGQVVSRFKDTGLARSIIERVDSTGRTTT
jgi:hypothetical protein